ncbi:CBS domain-containing protein [Paradesulfitobacterium ferrireducens]|uniref:CBS domain-containing protein n=1 Tax=Paradesulfitobacterium ferrireducens TaxID=2816476 RepID=UPI001A8F4EEE|nr:CBS domain-containing protein [Paradesulfitobacterium ferrireducens]
MKVRDIMTSEVQCATPNSTLMDVAKMMKQEDIGSVPVCEQDRLLGMVTDRDIVIRAVAMGHDVNSMKASEVMSKNVTTIGADADIHEAADLMSSKQIRRLPVVEQGILIGIIALGDLAVEQIHVDEAGEALSDISQGVHH